jgi:SNF2-related domain
MRPKSDLRPYQDRIATALYENDERLCVVRPGGGKTVAALTAIGELKRDGVIRHALVIAPKRVARVVWPDEIANWAHTEGLRYAVLTGSPQQRFEQLFEAINRDITIVGIDVSAWLIDELVNVPADHPLFDLLVIDEVSRLRNPKGKRANIIAKHADKWRMIWGLSGTLRPSSAEDLFMPARVVTRAKLWGKSFYKWQREHFYPLDYRGYTWAPLPGHEAQLNAEIAPLCVTLYDDELPQLPELSIIFDRIELPPEARRQYDDMHRKLFMESGNTAVLASSAAVATGKLAQAANGFMYPNEGSPLWIHDEKRQWLQDIIESAAGPTLLIYEFLEDLGMMRELLGDDLPYLGDGVTDKQASENIAAWNRRELPFMALHPASGGHGLNLQHGGSDQAWISPTWSPELWEQTIARLHRSGQTQPVIVRVCVAEHTVDQMKLDRVHNKISAQNAFEAYLRQYSERMPERAAE